MNVIPMFNEEFCNSGSIMKDASIQTKSVKKGGFGITLPVTYDKAPAEEECEIKNTSDVYKTHNLPWRFENPDKWNYGNAVFTCNGECVEKFSDKIDLSTPATWLRGHAHKKHHPLYTTTNMDYGSKPPTIHTVPLTYFPVKTKFSEHLVTCGMYRNRSLNTAMDRSKV